MKNKNCKKSIIIVAVVVICFAVFGAYKFVDTYSHSYAENKVINYLCQKYDEDASAFEVLDYQQARYVRRDNGHFFGYKRERVDFSFKVKYKGKIMFVKKYNRVYFDDYQITDIQKWGTDWLKENVDENIVGFDLDSYDILQYQQNKNKGNYYIMMQTDIEEFLDSFTYNDNSTYTFYFCVPKIDPENITPYAFNIVNKLNTKLTLNEISTQYEDDGKLELKVQDSKYIDWRHIWEHID